MGGDKGREHWEKIAQDAIAEKVKLRRIIERAKFEALKLIDFWDVKASPGNVPTYTVAENIRRVLTVLEGGAVK